MSFIVVGTNHKYSPIKLREKLAFSKRMFKEAILLLKERGILKDAVILSTCNRVEIYAHADEERGIQEIKDFIPLYHGLEKGTLSPYLYTYIDREAMKHLLFVACGIDSLIMGETQIAGQIKHSFQEAEKLGCTDEFLQKVFSSALLFAARIRRETEISKGRTSVGSVALDFIKEQEGALFDKDILIIGAGKVTRLVLQYLKKERPRVVFIANRTFEKAKELAAQIGAEAVRFDKLRQCLRKADIVITATASPHFIIKKEVVEAAAAGKRLLIVDLALPRDVDPRVKEIKNVDLFYLEDLESVIKKNIERKTNEAIKVREIIDREVENLWREAIELEQEPALLP